MTPAAKKGGLGRGLNALFEDEEAPAFAAPATQQSVVAEKTNGPRKTLPVSVLHPGAFQPRQSFDDSTIRELADSIATHGILQPLLVRPLSGKEGQYEIIGGERRWRAAQKAQLHEVPVIIKALDDEAAMEIALIENLQREDLGVLDEAEAYQRLMEEFAHTQEKLAKVVGKSRSHIANLVRLLNLPAPVRDLIRGGKLTAGHARALITAQNPEALARLVVEQGLSVRDTEKLAASAEGRPQKTKTKASAPKPVDTLNLERDLSASLGAKVSIDVDPKNGSGKITLRFRDLEGFDRVLMRLCSKRG